ncbi:MAG TPA: NAD(P)-dependent oxidoreductase [Patescibacteria group bacterium]
MKIAFIETTKEKYSYFSDQLEGIATILIEDALDEKGIEEIKDCEIICSTIYSKFDRKAIEQLLNLKYIVTQSTGFDHIDLEACKEKGVAVCNVPSYGERSIAEFTLGLMISLARGIHNAAQRTQDLNFSHHGLGRMDLFGKTLGIVGLGAIGKEFLAVVKGLEMDVLVYDIFRDEELANEQGFTYVDFEELLRRSDVVSLHVPYSSNTHHMMDRDAFSLMKDGSLLINTARGPVVDTDALLEALCSGKIAGAAFDVLEDEKILFLKQAGYEKSLARFEELKKQNIIYTPHMAPYTHSSQQRKMEVITDNLKKCLEGNPQNVVKNG